MHNSFDEFFKFIEDNNKNNKTSKNKRNKKAFILVDILAILLLIGGGYGIKYIYDQKQDEKDAKELTERIKKENKEKSNTWANRNNKYRDFNELKKNNPDTVAWLIVPGTTIDMPIVKTTDNEFYLTHGYDRKKNQMGWVFADSNATFPELSTNTIMYGHTYKRTTMFSNLKNVLKKKWLNNEDKQIITFDTEKERLKFKVFSVYTIKATNDYLYTSFANKDGYQKYLDQELKRSIKDFKTEVTTNDKILTLSTCYISDKERLVVHAKLIGKE